MGSATQVAVRVAPANRRTASVRAHTLAPTVAMDAAGAPLQQAPSITHLLALQRRAGNAAVTHLLAQRSNAWIAPYIQRAPAGDVCTDIAVDTIVDSVRDAITEIMLPGGMRGVTIDVEQAAAALSGLTPSRGRAVEACWLQRDKRSLRDLIVGTAQDPRLSNRLSLGDSRRLLNLLSGTVPEAAGAKPDTAAQQALRADVSQLHEALKRSGSNRERREDVFGILRDRGGPPNSEAFDTLNAEYKRQWDTGLYLDLERYLRGRDEKRAEALLEGDEQKAIAFEIETIAAETGQSKGDFNYRAGQLDAVEQRLEQVRMVAAHPGVVKALLDQPSSRGDHTLGESLARPSYSVAEKRLFDALISGSDAEVIAARLARLQAENRLHASDIEAGLIDLRTKVQTAFEIELTKNPNSTVAVADARTASFLQMRQVFQAHTGRSLDSVIASTGTAEERERNRQRLRGAGVFVAEEAPSQPGKKARSADLIELDLVLHSMDSRRIANFLGRKTKRQIDRLETEYGPDGRMWRILHLLSNLARKGAPAGSHLDGDELDELIETYEQGGVVEAKPGSRDLAELHKQGTWYWHRIEWLYKHTMDNRGVFARLRDWKGNNEHDHLVRAFDRAHLAFTTLTADGRPTPIEAGDAIEQVNALKLSYARLRRNSNVYNEATREAFVNFVDLAVTVVTIAISLTPGSAAALALRTLVGTVGTKLVLKQDEYSLSEFGQDVAMQGIAMGGSRMAESLVERVAPLFVRVAEGTGLPVSRSALAVFKVAKAGAGTIGGTIATEGRLPTAGEAAMAGGLFVAAHVLHKPAYKKTEDGKSEVKVHNHEIEVCPVQRCPSLRKTLGKRIEDDAVKSKVIEAERAAKAGKTEDAALNAAQAVDQAKSYEKLGKPARAMLKQVSKARAARTQTAEAHALLDEIDARVRGGADAREVKAELGRVPALAESQILRKRWTGDPKKAHALKRLGDIEARLRSGDITRAQAFDEMATLRSTVGDRAPTPLPTLRARLESRYPDVADRLGPKQAAQFDKAVAVLEQANVGEGGRAAVEELFTPGGSSDSLSKERFDAALRKLQGVARDLQTRGRTAPRELAANERKKVVGLAKQVLDSWRDGRTVDGDPIKNRDSKELKGAIRRLRDAVEAHQSKQSGDPIQELTELANLRDEINRAGEILRSYHRRFDVKVGEPGPRQSTIAGTTEEQFSVTARGEPGDSFNRSMQGIGLEKYMLTPKQIGELRTNPPSLARRLANLFAGYQRAHLIGPGFGGELYEGLMLAPEAVNQVTQNKGVEQFIRDQVNNKAKPHVEVKVTGRRIEVPMQNGTVEHIEVMTRIEYTIELAGGKSHRVVFEVTAPPNGTAVMVENTLPAPAGQ